MQSQEDTEVTLKLINVAEPEDCDLEFHHVDDFSLRMSFP